MAGAGNSTEGAFSRVNPIREKGIVSPGTSTQPPTSTTVYPSDASSPPKPPATTTGQRRHSRAAFSPQQSGRKDIRGATKPPGLPELSPKQEKDLKAGFRGHSSANYVITFKNSEKPSVYAKDWAEKTTPPRSIVALMKGEWTNNPEITLIPYDQVALPIWGKNTAIQPLVVYRTTKATELIHPKDPLPPELLDDSTETASQRSPTRPRLTRVEAASTDRTLEVKTTTDDDQDATDIEITLNPAFTPTEVARQEVDAAVESAKQRGVCTLISSAACGTPTRRVGTASLILLCLGGLAAMAYFVYQKLHPSCQEDMALTQRGSNQISGSTSLWFGEASPESGILVTMVCALLSLKNFFERDGKITLTLPSDSGLPSYERIFDSDEFDPKQDWLYLNMTEETGAIPCGSKRAGAVSVQVLDERSNIHRASLPISLLGQGVPSQLALLYNVSLGRNVTFSPFEGMQLQASYPDYSNRSSVVLETEQPHLTFLNKAEMKSLLETRSATGEIDFNPRGDRWFVTGSSDALKSLFSAFDAQMDGDTAIPGTETSDSVRLGLLNPCLNSSDPVEFYHTRFSYTAYETPLSISERNRTSTPLSVGVGSSAAFNPFAYLIFEAGSRFGDYEIFTNSSLTAGRSYPDGLSPVGRSIYRGNFTEVSSVREHRDFIHPNNIPSGDGVYYRSGLTILDHHTGETWTTSSLPLFVHNPAQTPQFGGPTLLTVTPGESTAIFARVTDQANRYDLMKFQVLTDVPGFNLPPDPNVILVGNLGFIFFQSMPYFMDYLSRVQYTLPPGPSGTDSYAHITLDQKGLVSGLSHSQILTVFGYNSVVLPTLEFLKTPGIINDYDFYPAQALGFNSTIDPKDALRTDISGYVRLFDLSRRLAWPEAEFTGSFSGFNAFVNGQVVNIPTDWLPGTQTALNVTVCAGFNATNSMGIPLGSHCDSRVLTQEIVDFPAEVKVKGNITLFNLLPAETLNLGDKLEAIDRNPAQRNSLCLFFAVTEKPEGIDPTAIFDLPGDTCVSVNQTEAQRILGNSSVLAIDQGDFNSAIIPSRGNATVIYGKSSRTLVFERTLASP